MSINACIYDQNHIVAGCVTDSVLARFRNEFETIRNKHFGEAVNPLLAVMEKALVKSEDKMGPDFLNLLKLISRKYRDCVPSEFVQEVSRAYHALVRHCCSQTVYDEVLEATINVFREAGFTFVGSNMQDLGNFDFEYKGKKVSVRMRERQDLYRFWQKESPVDNVATIYSGGDEYVVTMNGSASDLIDEIKACFDEEIEPVADDTILEEIIEVIGQLLNVGEI